MTGHERDTEHGPAHWTQDEKKRVMAAIIAFENRALFLLTCKRILYTSAAIFAALTAIRVGLGEYWTAFVVALQQGHH